MPWQRRLVRFAAGALVVLFVVLGRAAPASAHNTLEGSEPAHGAVLDTAPAQMLLRFAKDVPLDTASLELIDASGARQSLAPALGATAKDLVAPLPTGLSGEIVVRWRLLGPDGHVLTERIVFTVSAPAAASTERGPTTTVAAPGVPDDGLDLSGAPDLLRFATRVFGFVAAILVGGVAAIGIVVMPGIWRDRRVRDATAVALVGLALTAALSLLILAGDVAGGWPLPSLDDLGTALELDAGRAYLARLLLTGSLGFALFSRRIRLRTRTRWNVIGALTLLVFASWSYAGHARTLRWAWLGVPLDVVHYAAAAVWLGGLLLMAAVVLPSSDAGASVRAVSRFSSVAAASVAALVATGAIQGVRLVGGPHRVFETGHGRLLLAKLVVLAAMLYVANVNRQRVQRRFGDEATATPGLRRALRRAMATESGLGLGVLAVTAALVVSTPATARDDPVVADRTPVESVSAPP